MTKRTVDAKATARLVDHDTFDRFLFAIRPTPDELVWRAIPWQRDLGVGLEVARREAKPILLWAMNGHPLGAT
jgi:hypothetical protein